MKSKLGIIFVILGAVLLSAALSLLLYNEAENREAANASVKMLDDVVSAIESNNKSYSSDAKGPEENQSEYLPDPYTEEMTVTHAGGYSYVGYISIPKLENLELPILSEWSYSLLKKAPCRYSGSVKTDDLVLLGHNYTSHFGKLDRLNSGDTIYFVDMDGILYEYEVIGVELLSNTSVEEMISGEYDLTLFTCDYSGNNRFTVRCNKVER